MEISIPVMPTLVTSNVVDHTKHYDQTVRMTYKKGLRLRDATGIYERSGSDLYPPEYEASKDSTYKEGDVLWATNNIADGYGGGGTIKGVIHVTGRSTIKVPMQPDLYPPADIQTVFGQYSKPWTARYILVKTGINGDFTGFVQDSGSGAAAHTHKLYRNPKSPTGWTYDVVRHVNHTAFWEDSEFAVPDTLVPNVPKTYIRVKTVAGAHESEVELWFRGAIVAKFDHDASSKIPYESVWTGTNGSSAGVNFLLGDLERSQEDASKTSYKYYRISKQVYRTTDVVATSPATVYDYLDADTVEVRSYYAGVGSGDADYKNQKDTNFILRTFILRGSNLYARTDADAVQLTSPTTKPKLEMLKTITEFKTGWTYVSPIAKLKPFDNKSYTKLEASGTVTFKLRVDEGSFNTVAFTKLIAETLDVKIVTPKSVVLLDLKGYKPNGARDIHNRLPMVGTTAIIYTTGGKDVYMDAPAGSTVEITIKGKRIQVGSILTGLSVNAGFTNLVFSNKYKDYSPYEKDHWGNITYIEGVKTNIHAGTVDVPIRHYDMMNRLMISLGQGLVILNGSSTLDNAQPDNNRNIFASTMVVGRIRDFQLRTNLVNKSIGEMATYSLTCEEDV